MLNKPPGFVAIPPSTMQAVVDHFETARARYLASLRTADGGDDNNNNTSGSNAFLFQKKMMKKNAPGLGRPSRGHHNSHNQLESSDSDSDGEGGYRGLTGTVAFGGVRGVVEEEDDDDAQVEGGVPSGQTKLLLGMLDRWMALKNGKEGDVDVDMLSALDLADGK
jgi:hypothetical protein